MELEKETLNQLSHLALHFGYRFTLYPHLVFTSLHLGLLLSMPSTIHLASYLTRFSAKGTAQPPFEKCIQHHSELQVINRDDIHPNSDPFRSNVIEWHAA